MHLKTDTEGEVLKHHKILKAVADFYGMEESQLFINTRSRDVARPRQVAMYLLREIMEYSYPYIGRIFKGKHHTTALHAHTKIAKGIQECEFLSNQINLIRQNI